MWCRREIENYLTTRESLQGFVQEGLRADDLLDDAERRRRLTALDACLAELTNALRLTGKPDPWGPEIKVTDDFLDPLFRLFYDRLNTPQQVFKRDYHGLAGTIPLSQIDPEVIEVLDLIAAIAAEATPRTA